MSKPCPTGCPRKAREGHLMCGPCWAEVPRELRHDVLRTWRAFKHEPGHARLLAYRDAAEHAVAAVR